MRRIVLDSLVASVVYVLAGVGLEWASVAYLDHRYHFRAVEILVFLFPLALPYEKFSHAVGWGNPNTGVTILVFWLSAFLVCLLSSLWIRGLIRRKHRTGYLTRSACALFVFAALLTAYSDRDPIWLNLHMRNSDLVRADCLKLLQKRDWMVKEERSEMSVPQSELPLSLIAIGATSATVTHDSVRINFLPPNGLADSSRGFMYDPHQSYITEMPRWPVVKNTLYRDFYEFRVVGD